MNGVLVWTLVTGLPLQIASHPVAPPPVPIEPNRTERVQEQSINLEDFSLQIDGRNVECGAAELGTGRRAPFAYNPESSDRSREVTFQATTCRFRF